ncbi:hypothetical protein ECEC1737_1660, partial [Escherichia coli EC1737]
VYCSQ